MGMCVGSAALSSFLLIFSVIIASCGSRQTGEEEAQSPSHNPSRVDLMALQDHEAIEDQSATSSEAYEPDPHHGRKLVLPAWYAEATAKKRGDRFCLPAGPAGQVPGWNSAELLRTLGFRQKGKNNCFFLAAELAATAPFKMSQMPTLPEVDGIAISSVFRPGHQEQYIFRTLRSLFGALPPEAFINVFVGNDDDSYVNQRQLIAHLGEERAQRVHVVPAVDGASDFFRSEQVPVRTRATWNYVRVLRSYRGEQNLMFFEDDVELAHNSVEHLRPWLADMPGEVLVLFNRFCPIDVPLLKRQDSELAVWQYSLQVFWGFGTTQAVVYPAGITSRLADFMGPRAYAEPYDNLLGQAVGPAPAQCAMVQPSIVQHFGFSTTGLSSLSDFPISHCYQQHL